MTSSRIFTLFFCFTYCTVFSQVSEERSSVVCTNVNSDVLYNYYLDSIGSWNNSIQCSGVGSEAGGEVVMRFSPGCTNTFIMEVSHTYQHVAYPVGFKISNGNCTPGGFTCLLPFSTTSTSGNYYHCFYYLNVDSLTAYDILIDFDYYSGLIPGNVAVKITTPHVTNIHFQDITPDSLSIGWGGTVDGVIVEYGPKDFSPGSAATPGPQGIAIPTNSNLVTVVGLPNDSVYDFYVRDKCGNSFSANSLRQRIRIPEHDSLINNYACGNGNISFQHFGNSTNYPGSWQMVTCGGTCPPSSPEKIVRFVPDSNGMYVINKYSTGSTSPDFHLFYKEVIQGLNEQNWNCIGTGPKYCPWSHEFGPLNAGTPYYVMFKATQDIVCNDPGIQTTNFGIDCFGICPILSSPGFTNVGYTSLTVLLRDCSTLGHFILEYGPAGFTPGTDSLPGLNGTIIYVSSGYVNQIINGLQAGTTYDFYLRQYCNVTSSFSSNSFGQRTTLAYCSVSPTGINSNAINNSICEGSSITLTQLGGLLSPLGVFKWFTDSCGGTIIGTGNSITISPQSSATYFVRSEDTCSTGICSSINVTVLSKPPAQILNLPLIEICQGDSVTFEANFDSTYTYQWKKNGNNILSANSYLYSTSASGRYRVLVSDSLGCSSISQESRITIICLPPFGPVERFIVAKSDSKCVIVPNPNNGNFELFTPTGKGERSIELYNSIGKLVYQLNAPAFKTSYSIDISQQPEGMYFLKVLDEKNLWVSKVYLLD